MSATVLTVQSSPPYAAGVAVTSQATDAVNGNVYSNSPTTALRIDNASGSPITVTFTLSSNIRNLGPATLVKTIAATTNTDFGFLDGATFNNGLGQVSFIVSSSTTVTAKVMQYTVVSPS